MNKLIEHNENFEPPLYLPSDLESLKEKHEYFEVPDLETRIQQHDKPHYWLERDILQIKQFHYKFFQNINLYENTVPQIKIFSQFLSQFLRFNYQLLWEQHNQDAYINYHQVLTEIEFLPFIISIRKKIIYITEILHPSIHIILN